MARKCRGRETQPLGKQCFYEFLGIEVPEVIDSLSNADVAAIPYVLRLELLQLSRLWDSHPGVGAWWERVRIRPSVEQTIFQRMTESDWTPFKSIAPDPWPKVRELLAA